MVVEKSLKLYDTKKTFFGKIGNTFCRILAPTKLGINSFLVNMKRSAMIKNYKAMQKCNDDKKLVYEKKLATSYSLYLESIDQLIIDVLYKKVKANTATELQKNELSNYYNIIHIKENDEIEYKFKKQQYLINLDFHLLKEAKKNKTYEEYKPLYIHQMDQLTKSLLKHFSMKLTEKMSQMDKEEVYNKIFETLEDYTTDILPLKDVTDDELIKEISLFETYEVGKLDQVDVLDKRTILLGISRKLFTHSLPLVACERCYIKIMKDTRQLIVDTKIARKRENAYQLLLREIEQYNDKLLRGKIYWDKPENKKLFNEFDSKRKILNEQKDSLSPHDYDVKKQILYIREDMKTLQNYDAKYFGIIKFYKDRLVKLGDMKRIKNTCTTGKYKVVKPYRKVVENEAAC